MRNQITPRQREKDLKRQAKKSASGTASPAKPEGPGKALDIQTGKAHKVFLSDVVSTIDGQPVLKHRRSWLHVPGRVDYYSTENREYRFVAGRFESWRPI